MSRERHNACRSVEMVGAAWLVPRYELTKSRAALAFLLLASLHLAAFPRGCGLSAEVGIGIRTKAFLCQWPEHLNPQTRLEVAGATTSVGGSLESTGRPFITPSLPVSVSLPGWLARVTPDARAPG